MSCWEPIYDKHSHHSENSVASNHCVHAHIATTLQLYQPGTNCHKTLPPLCIPNNQGPANIATAATLKSQKPDTFIFKAIATTLKLWPNCRSEQLQKLCSARIKAGITLPLDPRYTISSSQNSTSHRRSHKEDLPELISPHQCSNTQSPAASHSSGYSFSFNNCLTRALKAD